MLEFAKTIPANCKKIKEETYAQSKAFKRFPNTHPRKSRFGLTKGLDSVSYFGTVCVRRQLVGRDLLLGPSLDPSSPWLDFVKQSVHL